jgi:hypothetical protein
MPESLYRRVTLAARPARIVTFVNSADKEWHELCLRVIERNSIVWGGHYYLIVPTDGRTISPVFWKILEQYDPDYLTYYGKTGRDLQETHPEHFKELVAKVLKKHKEDGFEIDEDLKESTTEDVACWLVDGFHITEDLCKQLFKRLNPFEADLEQPQRVEILDHSQPVYEGTSVLDILERREQIDILSLNLELPRLQALYLWSVTGKLHESTKKHLNRAYHGGHVFSARKKSEILRLINFILSEGRFDETTADRHALGATKWLRRTPESRIAENSRPFFTQRPFSATSKETQTYASRRDHYRFRLPPVIVYGSQCEDFCLYYCLRRLGQDAYWLPDLRHRFFNCVVIGVLEQKRTPHHRQISLTSHSRSEKELESLKKKLVNRSNTFKRLTVRCDIMCTKDIASQIPYVHRIWARRPEYERLHFVDRESISLLETPIPRLFPANMDALTAKWITEVIVENYKLSLLKTTNCPRCALSALS